MTKGVRAAVGDPLVPVHVLHDAILVMVNQPQRVFKLCEGLSCVKSFGEPKPQQRYNLAAADT